MKPPNRFALLRRLLPGRWVPVCAMALLAMAIEVRAGVYLKMDGIPGEIADGRFAGWTQLRSATASLVVPEIVPPATTPGPTVFGIEVSKAPDRSTPELTVRCVSAQVIPRVTVAFIDGQTAYLRLTLRDVLITEVSLQGRDSGETETVSFTYQKIEWSTTDREGNGSGLTAAFDINLQAGITKPRLPFRATLGPGAGGGDLHLTCPVEAGHTYRVRSNATLTGPWQTVSEFTPDTDGTVDQVIRLSGGALFLRVEEVE
jgi:type VI protein secretion system component Hcp